jgi:hypothetical protein
MLSVSCVSRFFLTINMPVYTECNVNGFWKLRSFSCMYLTSTTSSLWVAEVSVSQPVLYIICLVMTVSFNGSSSSFRLRPLVQFRNHFFTDDRTPWMSDQPVAKPLPKHRTTQTQNKRIHTPNIHALSGIQTHDPSVRAGEDCSCLRRRGHCDRT